MGQKPFKTNRVTYFCELKNKEVTIVKHFHGITNEHLFDSCDDQVLLNCCENCMFRNED